MLPSNYPENSTDNLLPVINANNIFIIPEQLNSYKEEILSVNNILTEQLTDEINFLPQINSNITPDLKYHTEVIENHSETDLLTGELIDSQRIASQINQFPQSDNTLINARDIGVLNTNQIWNDIEAKKAFPCSFLPLQFFLLSSINIA
ncbi:MAG: hypothetical protein F6K18_05735 [Okeania sp. SIO2C2]|uniref:hypothetical protein n=1 Tax=Okeania sp. SIO2C2 TaxID=2607787 RepID=UPI0013BE2603|nr:hypothetical protein [Okeania sp. SIO2C2]NEP86361.1 hypothetical protein [Okeania sp. SIO2C2]